MYYTTGNETKFITIKEVMDILKGPNTQSKQDIVNRLSDYFYNYNRLTAYSDFLYLFLF